MVHGDFVECMACGRSYEIPHITYSAFEDLSSMSNLADLRAWVKEHNERGDKRPLIDEARLKRF